MKEGKVSVDLAILSGIAATVSTIALLGAQEQSKQTTEKGAKAMERLWKLNIAMLQQLSDEDLDRIEKCMVDVLDKAFKNKDSA